MQPLQHEHATGNLCLNNNFENEILHIVTCEYW